MKLPEGWATTTLGDCQAQTSTIDPRREPEREFDLFSVPSYSGYTPDRVFGAEIGSAKQSVQPGDVLLCKIVPHIRRGWVVPLPGDRRQIASGEWIVFRNHPLEPEFLRRFVLSDGFHQQFMLTVSGVGGSLMRARPVDAAKIRVPVPPQAEQRRIVAKLDALTARLTRARAELDRVPVLAERLRRSSLDIGTLPDEGEATRPLRNYLEHVRTGPFGSAVHKSDYVDRGIPLINPMHIKRGRIVPAMNVTVRDAKARELKEFRLAEGDVILGRRGEMGRCAVVTERETGFLIGTGSMALRPVPSLVSDYLQMFLSRRTTVEALERAAVGSTMVNLNQTILLSLSIFVPSPEQQHQRIAMVRRAFARADRLEAEATRARALIDRLESAILAKAFRGELVPQDPNDEPASVLLDRIRAQRAAAPKAKRGRAARASA